MSKHRSKTSMGYCNWAVSCSFALIQFLLQASAGLMAGSWQHEFHITATELGYLSGAFYISYVSMQIPVGLIYDTYGARKILMAALFCLCLGIVGLALSHSFWQGIFARIVMGIGSSFGFVGMLYVTASWFSGRQFGILVGLAETIAMLAVALGELVMAWIISCYGWRILMLSSGVFTLIIIFFVFLVIQENPESMLRKNTSHRTLLQDIQKVLSNKLVWMTGIYGFALFSIITVFVTLWGIPFYMEHYHYSYSLSSKLMFLIFLGVALGAPITSWLIERWKARQLILSSYIILAALLFGIILYVPNLSITTNCVLLVMIGFFSASYVQVFAMIKDNIDPRLQATASGTANMIFMLSAPILQPLVGRTLELYKSFPYALSWLEVMLFVGIFLSFFFKSTEAATRARNLRYENGIVFDKLTSK